MPFFTPARRAHTPAPQLRLEPLEAREVPAALATFSGGLLTVDLAAQPDHNVTISRQLTRTGYVVTVDGEDNILRGGGQVKAADVRQIVVNGDAFANRIGLAGVTDQAFRGLNGRVFVYGNGGTDYVVGSMFDDVISGGAGDDVLQGGRGSDRILGDAGRDDLLGEDGNDVLQGGAEDDKLNGGFGNDTLFGEGGNDRLSGSYDDDVLVGGVGADFLDGSFGADKYLRDATDTVFFDRADSYIYVEPYLPPVPTPKR